jgi:predicted exporter
VALALWGAGLLVACFVIARAPFNTDMTAFLPRSPVPAQRVMVDQLRDGVVSRVVLVAIEGAAPEALARLSRGTAERLRREKESFGLVGNGEETGFEGDRDLVWRNRYLLSPAVTPERFSAAALRAALEKAVRLLSSDLGILL